MSTKIVALVLFAFALTADFIQGDVVPNVNKLEESSAYSLAAGPVIGIMWESLRRRWKRRNK